MSAKDIEAKYATEFVACHLQANNNRLRFNRILDLAKIYKETIKNDKNDVLLQNIVDSCINNGESFLYGDDTNKMVKIATRLIKKK